MIEETNPIGRPSDFTQTLADEICSLIASGNSLRRVCMLENMPAKTTIFRWLRERKEFRDNYEVAVNERTEDDVEDIRDIADDGSNDFQEQMEKDGSTTLRLNSENIQRSRLRVDTRKWIASKRLPKKYGERIEATVEHSGGLTLTIASTDPEL